MTKDICSTVSFLSLKYVKFLTYLYLPKVLDVLLLHFFKIVSDFFTLCQLIILTLFSIIYCDHMLIKMCSHL